jgi:predicted nucleic acid-binding protein
VTAIVDAAPLVSAGDERDPHTNAARRALAGEQGDLIIPAPVTAEVDYLLRTRVGAHAARLFLEDVADGRFRVETLTQREHGAALALEGRYRDLGLGLADLSVIILANRFQTRRLITFDERHFQVVTAIDGLPFTLLPADS